MAIKKNLRIEMEKGKPIFFMRKSASEIVDMSQGGVPKVQVTIADETKTYVGYPFQIDQWEE